MDEAVIPGETTITPAAGTDSQTGSARVQSGPAYAVLLSVAADRVPSGPLNADSVPKKVLGIPVKFAIDALIDHMKGCRFRRCPHVPESFLQYRKWRPEAIADSGEQIHKVLWTHASHDFFVQVRKRILDEYRELAATVSEGSLLGGNKLSEVLGSRPVENARKLTAVLWALGFEAPEGEALFRILLLLAANGVKTGNRAVPNVAPARKNGDEHNLRTAIKERKLALQAAEKAQADLLAKDRTLNKLRDELEQLQRKHDDATRSLAAATARLRDVKVELRILKRDAERTSKSNAALRNDLRKERESFKQLEVKRSELAQQLALEKRSIEEFKANHKTGAPAVWDFLQQRLEQIDIDRTITSGGDKERAKQAWTAHKDLEAAFLGIYREFVRPRPAKLLPKSRLRLRSLGGANEVGRSCYLLELGKRRILVDCGIKPSARNDLYPNLDELDRIAALLITHAHTDHIGWVPALVNKFGDFEIYCSTATAALLPIMLDDCRRHYLRKIKKLRDNTLGIRNAAPVVEAYEEEDVMQVPNLVSACGFDHEVGLPFGVSLRFFPAGHILGASSILLQDESGRRVFISGDFSSFSQRTVPAAVWPSNVEEVDLLVLESTYAGYPHHSIDQSREQLISLIRETVVDRGGSVILPSFALGRAQEILSLINEAREDGRLPNSVPVHIDGMIKDINPVYKRHAEGFDISAFDDVSSDEERQYVIYEAQSKPAIIVTTSGMMMGGPVIEYARHLLPHPRHRIIFSGYQDEGAPSKELMELERGGGRRAVEVADEGGDTVRIEAAVPAKHVGLSAHADQSGLVEYAGRVGARTIALVHGELTRQEKLQALLQVKYPDSNVVHATADLEVT